MLSTLALWSLLAACQFEESDVNWPVVPRSQFADGLIPPPDVARTPADDDRLHAVSLFATGRLHENRDQTHKALRFYQRAARYDPQSDVAWRDAVRLAIGLERQEDALAYLLLGAEQHGVEFALGKQLLAVLLAEQDFDRAERVIQTSEKLAREKPEPTEAAAWRMQLGRVEFLRGNYLQAADIFTATLKLLSTPDENGVETARLQELLGDMAEFRRLLAESLLGAKRWEEAREALRQAFSEEKDKPQLSYHLARIARGQADFLRAIQLLETALNSGDLEAGAAPYELWQELYEEIDESEKFASRLRALSQKQPSNLPLQRFLADRAFRQRNWKTAADRYEDLVALEPTPPDIRRLLEVYHRVNRCEDALGLLAAVFERTAGLDMVEEQLAQLVQDRECVEEMLRRRQENPFWKGRPSGAIAAGLVALEVEDWQAAQDNFEAALEESPGAQKATVYFAWGNGLLAAERLQQARDVFRRAREEIDTPAAKALFSHQLAGALALREQYDEALAAAREAQRLAPDSLEFQEREAWILSEAGRTDEARTKYRELLHRWDEEYGSPGIRVALRSARALYAYLEAEEGNSEQAEEVLEQILDEFPDDAGASNDLSYLWAERGQRLHRALELSQKAVAARPDNYAYRDTLGWVLHRLGRHDDAARELSAAAEAEKDPIVLDHLGDVYAALQRDDEARAAWQRALEGFQQQEDTQRISAVRHKLQTTAHSPDTETQRD